MPHSSKDRIRTVCPDCGRFVGEDGQPGEISQHDKTKKSKWIRFGWCRPCGDRQYDQVNA